MKLHYLIAVFLNMMKVLTILLTCGLLFGCKQKSKKPVTNHLDSPKELNPICDPSPTKEINHQGINLKVFNFEGLKPLFNENCNDIHIINFWATWCKPCVAELPYFERLHIEQNIPVTLVSLDMPNLIESKLIPFIKKEKLQSEVLVLDDPDANAWIPKIDSTWSGAIPATIIFKNGKKKFYEQSFTYETLNEALNKL